MPSLFVIGSINMDLVAYGPQIPRPGETVLGSSMETIPGGKGANQAVAASRMGGKVTMLGCVGDDSFGEILLEGLKSESIDIAPITVVDRISSGIAMIQVDPEGQNAITVIPGANAAVTVERVREQSDLIEAADVLLMQLEIPCESVVEGIALAKNAGVPVVLDPAPVPPISFPLQLYGVDVFSPNQRETHSLTGIEVVDSDSAGRAGRMMIDQGAKAIVIKAGALGAYILQDQQAVVHVPAFPAAVADTTAAGDAFSAALALGLAEGRSLEEATRWACKAGAIAVSRLGAQPAMPYRKEMEE